jgi:hypothetical protein
MFVHRLTSIDIMSEIDSLFNLSSIVTLSSIARSESYRMSLFLRASAHTVTLLNFHCPESLFSYQPS